MELRTLQSGFYENIVKLQPIQKSHFITQIEPSIKAKARDLFRVSADALELKEEHAIFGLPEIQARQVFDRLHSLFLKGRDNPNPVVLQERVLLMPRDGLADQLSFVPTERADQIKAIKADYERDTLKFHPHSSYHAAEIKLWEEDHPIGPGDESRSKLDNTGGDDDSGSEPDDSGGDDDSRSELDDAEGPAHDNEPPKGLESMDLRFAREAGSRFSSGLAKWIKAMNTVHDQMNGVLPRAGTCDAVAVVSYHNFISEDLIEYVAGPTQPEMKIDVRLSLFLPVFLAEYKKEKYKVLLDGMNQLRKYLNAAVTYLCLLGITDFPVFGVYTEGTVANVMCAWMKSDKWMKKSAGGVPDVRRTMGGIIERSGQDFDISIPVGAFNYATFLSYIRVVHAAKLAQLFTREKQESLRRKLEAAKAGDSDCLSWTLDSQRKDYRAYLRSVAAGLDTVKKNVKQQVSESAGEEPTLTKKEKGKGKEESGAYDSEGEAETTDDLVEIIHGIERLEMGSVKSGDTEDEGGLPQVTEEDLSAKESTPGTTPDKKNKGRKKAEKQDSARASGSVQEIFSGPHGATAERAGSEQGSKRGGTGKRARGKQRAKRGRGGGSNK
ncbi:hypothetical protein BV25DRAFT_1913080 [Artomyces pyxidatus]|uniref:Uncharacterized protein n=1 Tax=Artomyces pyxidatus TaxID=48021 RepID=A0ACB8TCT4_9AGAM|nr:hypothetical protein BV25DRAFT_1913080 [Artomyces pyxidatus]